MGLMDCVGNNGHWPDKIVEVGARQLLTISGKC